MPEPSYRVYPYRWVILAVFMFINLTIQVLWICFAPITGQAAAFYGVSDLQIGFLAMTFMIVYVPLSIPISWMIDTLGYRKAVSIGALVMGVFALLRGLFAYDYTWTLVCTLGIAVAQPFMLNSITTVAAKWFPLSERATASGLAMVAGFLGIGIGQVLSPVLMLAYGIPAMQMIYGGVTALSVVFFLVFTREAPPTPPCPTGQEERALVLTGLKSMLVNKNIWIMLALFLVGMGVFNGISTWIEEIVRPRGYAATDVGNLGGSLLLGGILGAAVIPLLSDKLQKRKIFLLLGLVLAIPGLLGFTFAQNYWLVVLSLFSVGFFLMSLAPVGYQYAAEITFPAPEGTSNGLLNLAGQVSVVFIYAMEAFKNADGTFTFSLVILAVLLGLCCLLVMFLQESKLFRAEIKPAGTIA
ncbi:MAG: MFS transporter [Anaerolineaceae bacterium]